jgi:hypothetical protein
MLSVNSQDSYIYSLNKYSYIKFSFIFLAFLGSFLTYPKASPVQVMGVNENQIIISNAEDFIGIDNDLEATYTFVRQQEQLTFSQKTLRYNVRQIQFFPFYGVNTRATYRLDVHTIATRIVFFSRRSDAIPYRNQSTNLTNWMYPISTQRPFVTPLSGMPSQVYVNGVLTTIGRSGLNLPGLQRHIFRNIFLTANGQPLFDSQDSGYFSEYVPFRYHKGDGAPFQDYGLATQSEMWPLHAYSFALDASSIEQPTGTLNTSRIDRLEMDVDVEPIPVGAFYTYEIHI